MTKDYEKWFALTIVCYLVLWVLLWGLIARAGSTGDLVKLGQLRECKTLLQTVLWITLTFLCFKSHANLLAGVFLAIAAACFVVFLKPELLVSNERFGQSQRLRPSLSLCARIDSRNYLPHTGPIAERNQALSDTIIVIVPDNGLEGFVTPGARLEVFTLWPDRSRHFLLTGVHVAAHKIRCILNTQTVGGYNALEVWVTPNDGSTYRDLEATGKYEFAVFIKPA